MPEITPQDRIKVIDNPSALPSKCSVCGHPGYDECDSRKFVDFGLQIDWYGSVIFCTECLKMIALGADYIYREEYDRVVSERDAAWEQRDTLLKENSRLRDALASVLGDANHSLVCVECDARSGVSSNSESEDAEDTSVQGAGEDSGFLESLGLEGSSDVSSNSADEAPKPRKSGKSINI